jgi:hypothetical protein
LVEGGGFTPDIHVFRPPPGRRTLCGVQNRSRRFCEPPSVLILPL